MLCRLWWCLPPPHSGQRRMPWPTPTPAIPIRVRSGRRTPVRERPRRPGRWRRVISPVHPRGRQSPRRLSAGQRQGMVRDRLPGICLLRLGRERVCDQHRGRHTRKVSGKALIDAGEPVHGLAMRTVRVIDLPSSFGSAASRRSTGRSRRPSADTWSAPPGGAAPGMSLL